MGLRDLLRQRPVSVGDLWEGDRAYIQERDVAPWPGTYAIDADGKPFAELESVAVTATQDDWYVKAVI